MAAACEAPAVGPEAAARGTFAEGVRASVAVAVAVGLVGVSFGALSQDAGFSFVAAVVMSLLVFSGSAQLTAVAILAAGGSASTAVVAAALMNARYLMMGVALAPSLPGGPLRRALQSLTIVDAAWALAAREDGRFDRVFMFGSSAVQYGAWVAGTALGAAAGQGVGDPHARGLDAGYPAFFLALLIAELGRPSAPVAALGGAVVALALVPFVPAGVPVLVASVAALAGLRARREAG